MTFRTRADARFHLMRLSPRSRERHEIIPAIVLTVEHPNGIRRGWMVRIKPTA